MADIPFMSQSPIASQDISTFFFLGPFVLCFYDNDKLCPKSIDQYPSPQTLMPKVQLFLGGWGIVFMLLLWCGTSSRDSSVVDDTSV